MLKVAKKQDYTPPEKITGVQLVDLKVFTDDGGFFIELARFSQLVMNHFPDFQVQQINYSEMDPGAIKAWHLHKRQDDIWFIPPSQKLLIALKDLREDSSSHGVLTRIIAGRGRGQLLHIPRGVAHGAANLWSQPAAFIYFVNQQFTAEPDGNDEYRLPWDSFGSDIWQMTKG